MLKLLSAPSLILILSLSLGGFATTQFSALAAPAKKKSKVKTPKTAASPTVDPWATPSATPSAHPSAAPSALPSATPSAAPSTVPSAVPSAQPSVEPSAIPSPVPAVSITPVAEKEPEPEAYGRTHGILGPVTFGPTVTLLSIPHPLQVGLESKYKDLFVASVMVGVLPKITIGENSIKMDSWDVGLHWHPFRGAFFLGGAIGKQKLTGTHSQVLVGTAGTPPVAYSANTTLEVTLETTVLTPMLGWRWQWHSGFFYGLELGWQFASSPKAGFTTTPETPAEIQAGTDYQKIQADLDKAANDYGKQGLPHFTLIQIGWLF